MSCYIRHLEQTLKKAGLESKPETRRLLDRAVREVLGAKKWDCPVVWKKVKEIMQNKDEMKKFEEKVIDLLLDY